MGAGDFNGKNFDGRHTGSNLYKYNMRGMPNYTACVNPTNAALVEGTRVKYVGKGRYIRSATGYIMKNDNKYGRSRHKVKLSVYNKKTSEHKTIIVYCQKTQLVTQYIYKDKHDIRVNELIYKRELRKRKKMKFKKQQQKLRAT